MHRSFVVICICLTLMVTSLMASSHELPLCDIPINEDKTINPEDILKLHNCRTIGFPISKENGFKNDLGSYSGEWVNGKREGRGFVRDWLSLGVTADWKNDRPINGFAHYSSCTSRTYGYIFNGRFYSFTMPLDLLSRGTRNLGLPLLPEIMSNLGALIHSVLDIALN